MFKNLDVLSSKNYVCWFENYLFSLIGLKPSISTNNTQTTITFAQRERTKTFVFNHIPRQLLSKSYLFKLDATSLLEPLGESGELTFLLNQSHPMISSKIGDFTEGVNFDILAVVAIVMLRGEEYDASLNGSHERFSLKDSILFDGEVYKTPFIDEWINILWDYLKLDGFEINKSNYEVHVSHDIDDIFRLRAVPLKQKIRRLISDIIRFRRPKPRGLSFDWLMKISDYYNLKSHFFFISDNTNKKYDFRYNIFHRKVKDIIENIGASGHYIGPHYSYSATETFNIKSEWSLLSRFSNLENQDVVGGRFHYLRVVIPDSYDLIVKGTSQSFDNTLTFYETGGFRCGTSRPFNYFNLDSGVGYNLKIIPLVIMDSSVFGYLGLRKDEAFNYIKFFIDECKRVNGSFTLLWHNDGLNNSEQKFLYQKILDYATR